MNSGAVKSKVANFRSEIVSKERASSVSSVDAAAIQDEMARKYNLSNRSAPKNLLSKSKRIEAVAITDSNNIHYQAKPNYKTCNSCGNSKVEANLKVCNSCGCFFGSSGPNNVLTLAQKRGLIAAPAELKQLTVEEWEDVEYTATLRQETACPICMTGFNQQMEVLLSCTHMFHRTCIASFEKFNRAANKRRKMSHLTCFVCPICRAERYQKRLTTIGTKAYRRRCCVRIQALLRGSLARMRYRLKLRQFYNQVWYSSVLY